MFPRHTFLIVWLALGVFAGAAEPVWRWQEDLAPDPGFDLDSAQVCA